MEVKNVNTDPYDELLEIVAYLMKTEDQIKLKYYKNIWEELGKRAKVHAIIIDKPSSESTNQPKLKQSVLNPTNISENKKTVKSPKLIKKVKKIKNTSNGNENTIKTSLKPVKGGIKKKIFKAKNSKPKTNSDNSSTNVAASSLNSSVKSLDKLQPKELNKPNINTKKDAANKLKPVKSFKDTTKAETDDKKDTLVTDKLSTSSEDDSQNVFSNLADIITDDEDQEPLIKAKGNGKSSESEKEVRPMRFKLDSKETSKNSDGSELKCEQCTYTSALKRRFEAHLQTHKYKQFKCIQCDEDFILEETYKQHMERHIKNFSCDLCDKQFSKEASLVNHKYTKHPESLLVEQDKPEEPKIPAQPIKTVHTPTSIKIRKCPHCNYWTNALHLETHLASHANGEIATETPMQEKELKSGTEPHSNNSSEAKQQTNSEVKAEVPSVKKEPSETNEVDSALGAPTNSINTEALLTQSVQVPSIKTDPVENKEGEASPQLEVPSKTRVCKVCQMVFSSSFTLRKHSYLHWGTKILRCAVCKYRCLSPQHLGRHLKMHAHSWPYKCSKLRCKSTFRKLSHLQQHLRAHRRDTFRCTECAYSTAFSKLFKLHKAKSHPALSQGNS